nr:hypothetical protein [Salinibacter grassmerensis]
MEAGVTIELTTGDIAEQSDMEAVVSAANAQLRTGRGVAGALQAIFDAAPDLASVAHVRFVLFDEDALSVHEQILAAVQDETDS